MSTANTLGVPKLLPVTGTFTIPVALIHTALCWNVIKQRIATKTFLGRDVSTSTAEDRSTRTPVAIDGATGQPTLADPLLAATSAHTNFIENVPFALIFAGAVELNGGNRKALTSILSLFMLARVAHAYGLSGGRRLLKFRQVGFFGTLTSLLGLAGWSAYLVRGYWGI